MTQHFQDKGVIIGYAGCSAESILSECPPLRFVFKIGAINDELIGGVMSLAHIHEYIFWGDPTPETLAKYLKK